MHQRVQRGTTWSLLHGRQGRLGYGAGVAYVFTTAVHSSVLGAPDVLERADVLAAHARAGREA